MTDSQPVPEQRSRNPETVDFTKLPKRTKLSEKFKLPAKRGFALTEGRRADSYHPANPIHKSSMTSMVWNISIGQRGLAAWLCSLPAPAHLLIS